MNEIITTKDVHLYYGKKEALKGITLDFPQGGIHALIGPSGCGKSTYLRCLNRMNDMIANVKITGDIKLDGNDIYSPQTDTVTLRKRVGMVFQTPQVFPVSVFRNIAVPLAVALGCPRSELDDRVRDALMRADLWKEVDGRLDMAAERLSGGQQQRLCLARALALEPDVLLLDEPTASLDVHAARRVEDLLLSLAERLPVIMVSHGPAQSLRLASFLAVMEEGRVRRTVSDTSGMTEGDLERMIDDADRSDGAARGQGA